jgi:hypothetical protein
VGVENARHVGIAAKGVGGNICVSCFVDSGTTTRTYGHCTAIPHLHLIAVFAKW